MRIGTGDEFVRTTGGTISGKLTISVNDDFPLTVNRPDGNNAAALRAQTAGVTRWSALVRGAEPKLMLLDVGSATRLGMDMSNGLISSALVPLSLMQRDEQWGENAGAVTVLAGATTIAALASMTLVAGDRVLVFAYAVVTKGATAGLTDIYLTRASGTATVVWESSATGVHQGWNMAAGVTNYFTPVGILRCTAGGTCLIELQGTSAGSNSTVPISGGNLHALALRGTTA